MAARRYLNSVLLSLDIDADHITVQRFQELLEYFAENPTEYWNLTNDTNRETT